MNLVMSVAARGLSSTTMVRSLASLYGAGPAFSRYLDGHLAQMQRSSNATIERSGRVLEGCKAGFGIGYAAPVVVIAAGQIILGNSLQAVATVATAATLTNPMAMTCAAVGAVLYGYHALNDDERDTLVQTLADGLRLGAELVKAIISFAIERLRDLLTSEQMAEIKLWVKEVTEALGRHLGDVTRLFRDRLSDGLAIAAENTVNAASRGGELVRAGAGVVAGQSVTLAGSAYRTAHSALDSATQVSKRIVGRGHDNKSD